MQIKILKKKQEKHETREVKFIVEQKLFKTTSWTWEKKIKKWAVEG